MGSLTRRMRKRAPVEAYSVKRLPATPARGEVFVNGFRVDPLDPLPLVVTGPASQGEVTYVVTEADDDRARAYLETAPQSKVFTVVDDRGLPVPAPKLPEVPAAMVVEAPRRRPSAMQLIALVGMLGISAGLPPRGER